MSSQINNLRLESLLNRIDDESMIEFELSFSINGKIRDNFNQDIWTDAYSKHDNLFRLKYVIELLTDKRRLIEPISFVKKASFYWSRDPKLPPLPPNKKIWVMIVSEDHPIIPSSEEEAKSLLFDVKKRIVLATSKLKKGENKVYTNIKASWGDHVFASKDEINATSNYIIITKV